MFRQRLPVAGDLDLDVPAVGHSLSSRQCPLLKSGRVKRATSPHASHGGRLVGHSCRPPSFLNLSLLPSPFHRACPAERSSLDKHPFQTLATSRLSSSSTALFNRKPAVSLYCYRAARFRASTNTAACVISNSVRPF